MKPAAKDKRYKPFTSPQGMFGAIRPSDGELVVAVEATGPEEARARVASVVHLLGLRPEHVLQVRRLKATPTGVPTFFKAYFEPVISQNALARVGPSTRTVQ